MAKKTTKKASAPKKKPTGRSTAAPAAGKVSGAKATAAQPSSLKKTPKKTAPVVDEKSKGKSVPSASKTAKSGAKPAAKPETKPTSKPAKSEAKEVKSEAKSDAKVHAKSDAGDKSTAAKANGKPAKESPKALPKKVAPEPKPEPPGSKSGRKGITIVTPKPVKKARAKSSTGAVPALSGSVFGMGFGSGKPLIPSGPAVNRAVDADGDGQADGKKPKSPFNKKQLDQFRDILIAKRRELLGDIDSMENEALKGESGSLSNLPQHMAEQGSETYEQSLSLDLAAADRVLLREIDAALGRIADRTYGLCEHTGKPISKERLAELPWARYSIEAAREMERRAR